MLTPERNNGKINLSKYFISSSGDRIHNQLVLQSHFVPLRHDWPQQLRQYTIIYKYIIQQYYIFIIMLYIFQKKMSLSLL